MTSPLRVPVPVGARVMVVSDLLLGSVATASSSAASGEVAQAVSAWEGPGVVVVAGNLFDLLTDEKPSVAAALEAHPTLAGALRSFSSAAGRQVVCLPGSRDRALAYDAKAAAAVAGRLGATVAGEVDLEIETGGGTRTVRVEPGQRFDPRFAVGDASNPAESPLGQHLLTEILPALTPAPWSAGASRLTDPGAVPRFLMSRLVYRRLLRYAWWLIVPFAVGIGLKYPLIAATARHPGRLLASRTAGAMAGLVAATTAVDLLVIAFAVGLVARRAWAAVGGIAGPRASGAGDPNGAARSAARDLITAGAAGLVCGHSLNPELTPLGDGFFACAGAATEVVSERDAWAGLPPVFVPQRLVSWVELEAGAELHVRLLRSATDAPGASVLERVAGRRPAGASGRPAVVASFPHGKAWPVSADPGLAARRARRGAAAVVALAGVVDLFSAFTPPLRNRLHDVRLFLPLVASQAADALVALSGLGLVFLARGVRRGQRQAWSVAVALLAGTTVLHLVKGADVEESVATLAVLAYLLVKRRHFAAAVDRPSLRRGLVTLAAGEIGAFVLSSAAVTVSLAVDNDRSGLSLVRVLEAVGGRMVGLTLVPLPHRLAEFVGPALLAVTVGVVATALWMASRPVVSRLAPAEGTLARARQVVARHGSGTLDYFALRSDKHFFFSGQTVVAYAVYGGVCLVSPDPVGPPSERDEAWAAFRRHADGHGWVLAVLGAGEEWLPIYRASGMLDMYVGDEAVVDVTRLTLEGGRHKSLRQAVNRVAKYGYTVSFADPAQLDPELRAGIEAVMTKSRRGDVERGFSMTLGRVFDPEDEGLLMAVAHDKDGRPVAFCQYVPAPGIDGYSLDLMRRDDGEHPNGLIDFLVVETARHLRERGMRGLGLNFATMRAVLAGESGDGVTQRVERWVLKRMSGSMQIESLWKFNAKFDPDWIARYFVYGSAEHLLPAAMAMARAESFWELPVIGRFLVPSEGGSAPPPPDQSAAG